MTAADALLAAVLADPADDLPRLLYADWLDDHAGTVACRRCVGTGLRHGSPPSGEDWSNAWCPACGGSGQVPDGRAARAEFIRLQIELWTNWRNSDRPAKECDPLWSRENELFDRYKCDWFGERWAILCHDGDDSDQYPDLTTAVVRRGFVDEVRLPLAAFVGGPCRRCDGSSGWVSDGINGDRHLCPACSGTGRCPGVAAALFAANPITRVVLTGSEPHPVSDENLMSSHEPLAGVDDVGLPSEWFYRCWRAAHGRIVVRVGGGTGHDLPPELFDRLPSPKTYPGESHLAFYPTRDLALTALSAACVAHGRGLAGLPPLPARVPA